ncbi:carbohydrate ABC transporter permease [Nocardia sp. XZ_19_385]|uniref:carbohydrate ABC transporter permease n=1 Tax=Nocardia sp. XZ_19_385 TaxID=2769488 RepID=UPI0018903738|nr:sugar ABC transporter permease [Nocardia sp. XZ_19_385]
MHEASQDTRAYLGRRLRRLTPYAFLTPSVVVIAALLIYPIYRMVVMSTQQVGLRQVRGAPAESVGTANYQKIFDNEVFWSSLRNTLIFAALAVTATLVVGTLVGLLIHKLGKIMSGLVITAAMLAWATPRVNVAVLWKWLFDDQGGVANWLLGLLPDWLPWRDDWTGHTWFLDRTSIYFVLLLCVVWSSFPFIAVSVLAGLKSIPGELHEAARVDGAGPWRTFWSITYPLLRPVFAVLIVLSIIWDFKIFDQLFILGGGTGMSQDAYNMSLYAYSQAFASPPDMGMGSAIAVVLTAILFVLTLVYIRQIARQEELR